MAKTRIDINSADNLGNDPIILKGLCDDSNKPFMRAYWEYKNGNQDDRDILLKKHPQWAKDFIYLYLGEKQ